ncbi:MAG: hypothetical protein AAFQ94_19630 [Bacteroidota bacterium]
MERTQELFVQIEDYLNGQMDAADKDAFERQMSSEEGLKAEVEKHRLLKEAMGDADLMAFQEKLGRVSLELKEEAIQPSRQSFSYQLIFKYAAAFLLLIVSIIAVISFLPNDQSGQLFQDYYTPYPLESSLRGSEESAELIVVKQQYKNEQYVEITSDLERLSVYYEQDHSLKLYLASCYLEQAQLQKAKRVLSQIPVDDHYRSKAEWFLALISIKEGKKEEALILLKQLSKSDSFYTESAMDILKELR